MAEQSTPEQKQSTPDSARAELVNQLAHLLVLSLRGTAPANSAAENPSHHSIPADAACRNS